MYDQYSPWKLGPYEVVYPGFNEYLLKVSIESS